MSHSGQLIFMKNVPGEPEMRELTHFLPYKTNAAGETGVIPAGYKWDGSSVPWLFTRIFPRHRHPIASCRHDWRCEQAKTPEERKWADEEFYRDVRKTSWWITAAIGYSGVRIGAKWGELGGRYDGDNRENQKEV